MPARVLVVVETDPDACGFQIAVNRAGTAADGGSISDAELEGWVRALEERASADQFFSSQNFYLAVGTVT